MLKKVFDNFRWRKNIKKNLSKKLFFKPLNFNFSQWTIIFSEWFKSNSPDFLKIFFKGFSEFRQMATKLKKNFKFKKKISLWKFLMKIKKKSFLIIFETFEFFLMDYVFFFRMTYIKYSTLFNNLFKGFSKFRQTARKLKKKC